MRIKLLVFAGSIIAGTAGTANASNVTSLDPQSIVLALQNAGYKAVLGKMDDGEPVIDTASDSNPVRIVMSDCTDHKSCGTSEFLGVWDCMGAVDKCKKVASDMNGEESPVHVLLINDGKTAVTYSYLLYDDAGISEKLFIRNFTSFSYYNSQFNASASKK